MTMTNDELRALADAVRHASYDDPFGDAELRTLADALESMSSVPRFEGMNVLAFCKWLRAQADAQPVAWSDGLGSFIAADEKVGDDPDILAYRVPLYAAPASPQAEEIDPHMLAAEDRFPDEQAEPKREPLSDGQVTDLWSWASGQDQGPETTQQHAFARAVERAAYERAAALVVELTEDNATADAISALGRQQ